MEKIQPLLLPSDYLAALVVPRANRKEIYRQAIITLNTDELADFMLLAQRNADAHFEYSGDMFFLALAECVGQKIEVSCVTEKKIADLCIILAQRNFEPIVISHIVQILSGRLERAAIGDILHRSRDEVRNELLTALIEPGEDAQARDLELSLKRLYEEREKEAKTLKYNLRNTNRDTPPDRIRVFNTFIDMQPKELVAIDRLASRHGGSIFKIAMSIQEREHLGEVRVFLQGKKAPGYAKAEQYLISLCN